MGYGLDIYKTVRIPIMRCTAGGIYLRWWFNGWHYYNFTNQHEVVMRTVAADIMTTQFFSVISKIERPTKLTSDYAYQVVLDGIPAAQLAGFTGLLIAERVEQYEAGVWREVDVTRKDAQLQEAGAPAYSLTFEITRKELPNTPAVMQKTQLFYIGDTLCDMDDTEIIPINKQVNDIAEMQDRQSDFTNTFKIRKTRAMRALFELSGEVGANTLFPYQQQVCKLVQDGIELITDGRAVLNRVDDQYYYVAAYSGNLNFFSVIANRKLKDLTLASCNHLWEASVQAASNVSDLDYVYPLCEPSDDGGITPMTDDGSRCEVWGGWLWPFIKIRTMFLEIFTAAGFTPLGDVLTDPHFAALFMPIVNLNISKPNTAAALKSGFWQGWRDFTGGSNTIAGTNIFKPVLQVSGANDTNFQFNGIYLTPYAATYKLRVVEWHITSYPSHIFLYSDGVQVDELTQTDSGTDGQGVWRQWDLDYTAFAGEELTFRPTNFLGCTQFTLGVLQINDIRLAYGSAVEPRLNMPDLSQTDFLKMISNLYGLIPETNARNRTVRFWNYSELYDNIPQARDWSAYLSERDDEAEFKFGDYAQNNYLRYKDSDDVTEDTGTGVMLIDDETLPLTKEVVQLPFSTCDEVVILTDEVVAQINFNKYQTKDDTYAQSENIDPRLVYVSQAGAGKTFGIRDQLAGGTSYDSVAPRKASTNEVSFAAMMNRYISLQKMLTKTSLRRAKFNLPAYEVAGFKHYTPIYLQQYKAYFYVNRINNYVVGTLCTIELIKL